jgi:hypothetical protein
MIEGLISVKTAGSCDSAAISLPLTEYTKGTKDTKDTEITEITETPKHRNTENTEITETSKTPKPPESSGSPAASTNKRYGWTHEPRARNARLIESLPTDALRLSGGRGGGFS